MLGEKYRRGGSRNTDDSAATHFEFSSGVKVDSNKLVSIFCDYKGKSMILYFDASEDPEVTSADIVIDGLLPSTEYYIYMDNYHNETVYKTGDSGSYKFTIDLNDYHTVFFHANHPNILFLDENGRVDQSIFSWDSNLKTATLKKDIHTTIQIDSNGIVLNGKQYFINGAENDLLFGVYIPDRNNVTIENVDVTNCRDGISFYNSSDCFLKQCYCVRNAYGISANLSSKINISQNTIEFNNKHGIKLYKSVSSTLKENVLSMSGGFAIDCEKSTFNAITINGLYNNEGGGIRIRDYSFENILEKNLFINNDCGICLEGYSFNCRVVSNILQSCNLAVFVESCHSIDIIDNDFTIGNGDAVNISGSDDCGIRNNSCTLNKGYGVSSINTHSIDISSNTLSRNTSSGLRLEYCDNCSTSSNEIKMNNTGGIELYHAHFNAINGNNLQRNNVFGLQIQHANSNEIYNNNFINNGKQVNDINSMNKFNKSKPDGGNYWSDFSENDENKDVIAEHAYKVSKRNVDEFPWTREGAWTKSPNNKKVGTQNTNGGPEEVLNAIDLLKKNVNTIIK